VLATTAFELALPAAEQGDIDDRLGPDEHSEQALEKDLAERISYFALLAMVFRRGPL
jgi:hypothetical protein